MAFTLIPWLRTGSQLQDSDGSEILTFDSNITETHTRSARATQHPVETGVRFSDHVIIEPLVFTADIVFTDSPIDQADPESDRAKRLYRKLIDLFEAREPFAIVTGLEVYENMIIEQIDVPRDKDSGFAIRASLVFKQIRIVESVTILIPERLLRTDVQSKGQNTTDVGQQGTDENEEVEEENQSLARAWLGGGADPPIDFGRLR